MYIIGGGEDGVPPDPTKKPDISVFYPILDVPDREQIHSIGSESQDTAPQFIPSSL